MSANKNKPHLLVIPEDDANRQIITGFVNHMAIDSRRIQVEPVAGGWLEALKAFESDHAKPMETYHHRHVLILIDFDNHPERLAKAAEYIPGPLRDRVFVLGCLDEPEAIREATGLTKEQLGESLAADCMDGSGSLWQNPILAHNQGELARMKQAICSDLRASS
jgi:hypothetical protein